MAYRLLTGFAMINAIFSNSGYEAAKKMLDVTALQHQAIASNISNFSTPGYKRIDLSPAFQDQLNEALKGGDTSKLAALSPSLAVDSTSESSNNDGNSVNLENELLAMNRNTMAHTLETQLVTGELMKLRMAMTGHA